MYLNLNVFVAVCYTFTLVHPPLYQSVLINRVRWTTRVVACVSEALRGLFFQLLVSGEQLVVVVGGWGTRCGVHHRGRHQQRVRRHRSRAFHAERRRRQHWQWRKCGASAYGGATRTPPTLVVAAGWLLFGTPNVAQDKITEQPEHDEEAEQYKRVHPERSVAALLGQNGVDWYRRRIARSANGEFALRIATVVDWWEGRN